MPINIFISSRMKEGSIEKQKRKLAKEAIEELAPKFKPILFEYEPPDSKHIRDWWRDRIKDKDTIFLILILNDMLSAAVFDEFRTASEDGVKTLVFLIDDKFVLNKELKMIDYPESGLIISKDELDWFYQRIKAIKFTEIKDDKEFKKDVRNAVLKHLEVPPEVPDELTTHILSKEDPELKRILTVYVEPLLFADAYSNLTKNKFLVITGDANVGKTSMAQHLADRIRYDHNRARILKIEGGRLDISLFKNVKNSVIIFDDAFGKSTFSDFGDYSGNIKEIIDLKEDNFVIMTTRREILDEAKKRQTRFTEYYRNIKENLVEFRQEGSYSDDALRNILKNHLRYYYETGKIRDSEVEIAQKNSEKIIKDLRFPHNIDVLVKEELKKVTARVKDIDEAIEAAKHIKIVAQNWFVNLDDTRKYFVFSVALFPGLYESDFGGIYKELIGALRNRHPGLTTEDLIVLRRDTSAYITEQGIIDFKHPNYNEGITEIIQKEFRSDLPEVIKALEVLAKDKSHDMDFKEAVVFALMELGMVEPARVFPLLRLLAKREISRMRRAAVILPLANSLIAIIRHYPGYRKCEIIMTTMEAIRPYIVLEEIGPDLNDSRWSSRRLCPEEVENSYMRNTISEKRYRDLYNTYSSRCDKSFILKILRILKSALEEIGTVEPGELMFRTTLAKALGEIGAVKPEETISLLKKLAEDDDEDVKETADEAISDILTRQNKTFMER